MGGGGVEVYNLEGVKETKPKAKPQFPKMQRSV